MFLILLAVGAGLCSAQTAGKKYYLVDGLFFEGMPPGVGSDNVAGRPMVLNFWYTGGGPCIREMPELDKWMEVYPDVTYLATTFDSAAQIKKIVESRPFLFTQIADDSFFFETFHVSGMPVTILVDKKGIIRHIEQGTGTAKLRYMQDKLQELVSE